MDVIFKEEDIEWDKLSSDEYDADRLPKIVFREAPSGTGRQTLFWLAGGRHRVRALELWAEVILGEMDEMKIRIQFLQDTISKVSCINGGPSRLLISGRVTMSHIMSVS